MISVRSPRRTDELMDKKENAGRILALITSTAMHALEKTSKEREGYLVMRRKDYFNDAISTGASDDVAQEWVQLMDKMVRDLIGLIERSGGGAGGEA